MAKKGYCTLIYEGSELETACEDLRFAGYDGVELYPKDWQSATSGKSIHDIKELLRRSKLKVSAVFGGVLTDERDLAGFYEAVDVGRSLGSDMVFFVAAAKQSGNVERFVSLARRACDYAGEKGMDAVLHHHAGTVAETFPQTTRLIDAVGVPNLGMCFDSVHCVLYEDDPRESILQSRDYIRYVHLKDLAIEKDSLLNEVHRDRLTWGKLEHLTQRYTGLNEGTIDNRAIARTLLDVGYDGWWIVEIERREYARKDHTLRNIEALRAYLADPGSTG